MQSQNNDKKKKRQINRGLKTAINPVLLSSNIKLVSKQYHNQNPYLSTNINNPADKKVNKRYRKGLRFHEKGEISSQIQLEREIQQVELEAQRQREIDEEKRRKEEIRQQSIKIEKGELPDITLGEDKYIKTDEEPDIEWWDKCYLDQNRRIRKRYTDNFESELSDDEDSEDEEKYGPSIRYVYHPVPIKVDRDANLVSKIYLTKDEQKRIRRNRRKLQREEKETRIKAGLDAKPEPKVKLSNMMSVYENDANIVDPTKWEQDVKAQVAMRKSIHEKENNKRHEEAVERRKMNAHENANEALVDDYCHIFWFKKLNNPKIRFKLNMNSKQLALKGACLRVSDEGSGIIVIIGKEKACKFFNKLVTRRIKWDETYQDQTTQEIVDMTGNHCKQIWEGYLKDCKFPKWFMKTCLDEEDLFNTLAQFSAQNIFTMYKQGSQLIR